MKRGDLCRVFKGSSHDPKHSRVFVLVSRQILIDSRFSTVTSAPVYSSFDSLSTQVLAGIEEGLKHGSAIHCDELISIPKSKLTNYIGTLSKGKIIDLDRALLNALDIV